MAAADHVEHSGDPRFTAPVAGVRRRVLAAALALAVLATLPAALLRAGEFAGWFALGMGVVLLLLLVLLVSRTVGQHAIERLLLAAVLGPTISYHMIVVATRELATDEATLFGLLLDGTQVGIGLAVGVSFILAPRWSLWLGLGSLVGAIAAVPVLRPELLDRASDVGEVLGALAIGLLVVVLLHLMTRTTAGQASRAQEAEDEAERRRSVQAMAAHDLRSPLSIATTALETLTARGDRLAVEQLEDIARIAGLALERATALSTDLLDESMVLVADLTHEPVFLADIVRDAVATSVVQDTDVTVVGCDLEVTTVPGRLSRMLVNLLDNADKHGAPPITVRGSRGDGTWSVAVEDAGAGLGQRLRDSAFGAFQRGPGTAGVEGQGLGLHIVQAFARSLGGEAHVEPMPTGGARFVLTLPD